MFWHCFGRVSNPGSRTNVKQKEHTASIKDKPRVYPQMDTPKKQNIIEIDCRGLEFVEFKADVCLKARVTL